MFATSMKNLKMTRSEILDTLERYGAFTLEKGWGSIGDVQWGDPIYEYAEIYRECKEMLESLPWNVVENPRTPRDCEYPQEDGEYITMLDCNEHHVTVNWFNGGKWTVYNRTHVKWWMKLPEQ